MFMLLLIIMYVTLHISTIVVILLLYMILLLLYHYWHDVASLVLILCVLVLLMTHLLVTLLQCCVLWSPHLCSRFIFDFIHGILVGTVVELLACELQDQVGVVLCGCPHVFGKPCTGGVSSVMQKWPLNS